MCPIIWCAKKYDKWNTFGQVLKYYFKKKWFLVNKKKRFPPPPPPYSSHKRSSPNRHRRATGKAGEKSLRASEWNGVLDCVYKLWVFMGKSLNVRAHVFSSYIFFLILLHVLACLCEREREREAETVTDTRMHPDCDTASHSHDLQFLLDYQQMEIRGKMLPRFWSLTDQTSTPAITPVLATWGHLLTALYDVVCLAQE